MTWLWDNAVTLSTLVMAIAAIAALIYAHLQIAENKRAERRANANELWRETLRLAFDNPKLSDPTLKLAQFDYDERTIDGSIELFQKYELYVDTILNASEEISGGFANEGMGRRGTYPAQAASRLSDVALLPELRLPRTIRSEISHVPLRSPGRPSSHAACAAESREDRYSGKEAIR